MPEFPAGMFPHRLCSHNFENLLPSDYIVLLLFLPFEPPVHSHTRTPFSPTGCRPRRRPLLRSLSSHEYSRARLPSAAGLPHTSRMCSPSPYICHRVPLPEESVPPSHIPCPHPLVVISYSTPWLVRLQDLKNCRFSGNIST